VLKDLAGLNHYGFIILILTLIAVIGVTITVLIIIWKIVSKKNIELSNSKGTIKIGNTKKEQAEATKVIEQVVKAKQRCYGERYCNLDTVNGIATKFGYVYEKISEFKNDVMPEQIRHTVQSLNVIREEFIKTYYNFLKLHSQSIASEILSKEDVYITGINFIELITRDIQAIYVMAFWENHFLDITEENWYHYRERKRKYIQSNIRETFDTRYPLSNLFSKDAIEKLFFDFLKAKESDFDAIFDITRSICFEKKKEELRLRRSLDIYVDKLCGNAQDI
jgi:hypothetical protein